MIRENEKPRSDVTSCEASSSAQQARQESNLQPPVLETGALPIELRTYVLQLEVRDSLDGSAGAFFAARLQLPNRFATAGVGSDRRATRALDPAAVVPPHPYRFLPLFFRFLLAEAGPLVLPGFRAMRPLGFGFGRGGLGPRDGIGPAPPPLQTGGASGACLKSKQSAISSDAASRALSGCKPNVFSQNLTTLTCEWNALEIPLFAYGLSTRQPTRGP